MSIVQRIVARNKISGSCCTLRTRSTPQQKRERKAPRRIEQTTQCTHRVVYETTLPFVACDEPTCSRTYSSSNAKKCVVNPALLQKGYTTWFRIPRCRSSGQRCPRLFHTTPPCRGYEVVANNNFTDKSPEFPRKAHGLSAPERAARKVCVPISDERTLRQQPTDFFSSVVGEQITREVIATKGRAATRQQ